VDIHLSWFAVVNFVAGLVNIALLVYVRQYWDKPGARWFLALIASQGAICFVYGTELLVAGPVELAYALSLAGWIGGVCNGLFWLSFGLTYTGRRSLLKGPLGWLLFAAAGVVALFVATDFVHGEFYSNFAITFELGAPILAIESGAGVQLTNFLIFSYTLTAIGILLETLVRSWPLYRTQTLALILAPIFAIAVDPVATAAGLVSLTEATLVPTAYGFTAILFTYALFGGSMLELEPVTRHLGQKAALDDLAIPVVTVDTRGRLISINENASDLLETTEESAFGAPLSEYLHDAPTIDSETEKIDLTVDGRRREYRVVAEPFEDTTGALLGYTLSFQDVTDITRRERRLTILNRVLRHNLRNDLNVVAGHASVIEAEIDDDSLADHAETIIETSQELTDVGEKARELDRIVDETMPHERVRAESLIESVVEPFRQHHSEATIETDVPPDLSIWTDSQTLSVVFENLIENALEHNDSEAPRISIRAGPGAGGQTDGGTSADTTVAPPDRTLSTADTADRILFEIADNGPGIPQGEVEVLRGQEETALKHGSGLGLWVVQAGVTALGGELSFESSADGTTVSMWVPGQVDPDQ
jgi:signal transduction histidine kinase